MDQEKKWIREIVRHGSRKAADALVRSYYDEIYAFVYRQTGNREDALDLTQECFLAVLRSLPSYNARQAGLRTWIYHIAAHKIIDMRRKQKVQFYPMDSMEEDITDGRDFEQEMIERVCSQEWLEKIEAVVQGAEPQVQEVFRLRVYGEYPFPEIAAAAAQPEAKIKAQYYRLTAKIRKELGGYGAF